MTLIATAIFLLATVASSPRSSRANDNGLAMRPPLGWRSWNLYGSNVNQDLIQKIMHGAVNRSRTDHTGRLTSLLDLGYRDIGLDDNWQLCDSPEAAPGMRYHRKDGSPIINLELFPDLGGMVDFAHSLNLTAGWYGNNCICADSCRTDHECELQIEGDVKALIGFGFDSWKLDGCGGETNLPLFDAYIRRHSPDRPVVVENCHWGNPLVPYYEPDRTKPPRIGCPWNFYRSSGDIGPNYASVMRNLASVEQYRARNLSYPGCWAYPDMMQVGVAKLGRMVLTEEETRSHFGSWCVVSSPLILSHDVTDDVITDAIWDVISNREAIAVNQAYAGDSGGVYHRSVETVALFYDGWHEDEEEDEEYTHSTSSSSSSFVATAQYQYLSKPLGYGGEGVAVVLINSGDETRKLSATFRDIPGINKCAGNVGIDSCSCSVRDVWVHRTLGRFMGQYEVEVKSHDAAFLILSDCSVLGATRSSVDTRIK